jgi:hypothetical protein
MPRTDAAVLIVEIGSITTRATLVDLVDHETRLLGRFEVPSTIEPPQDNAAIAILAAANEIAELTSRRLVEGNQLIMPQTNERDGVDQVVVVTSAAGVLSVVVAAVAADISGRSAKRAIQATYATTVQTITLDNSATTEEGRDTSWIERQVQMISGLQPDVVLIAGGMNANAQESLVRLAHIIGLTSLNTRMTSEGSQRQEFNKRSIIFAGNSSAHERVVEALSSRSDLRIVENLRPALDLERLDETRATLRDLYTNRILPKLPGMAALQRLCSTPPRTTIEAAGLMTRYIAALHKRAILAIDAGSASTTLHYASGDVYTPVVLAGVGTGIGTGGVLAERTPSEIARWLPFPIGDRELTQRMLNKMLRPQLIPSSNEELAIEQAVAREAMALAAESLRDMMPKMSYDLVIAGGGVLEHAPHPAMAALMILDALQPGTDDTFMAIDLHLDSLGLLTACGALAMANPEAALTLFEHDLLGNTPLATAVVALGDGAAGTPAIEAELRIAGQTSATVSVAHGQIARLPLEPGQRGQLFLRPANGVRIGRNAPGAAVSSDIGAVAGSTLGVIIDARGRPLKLPETFAVRQQLIWDWLVALGAESGALPYDTMAPLPDSLPPIIPFVAPLESSFTQAGDIPTLDSDLAKLRQTVAEPKKRGLFGKK